MRGFSAPNCPGVRTFLVLAALLLCFQTAQAELAPVVVTCLGDSVTAGYGSGGPQYTYPSQMEALFEGAYYLLDIGVINRGVGGYKAEDVRAQLQNEGLPENPDCVLLKIGGNDMAQAEWWNVFTVIDQTVAEVQDCVDLIKAHTNPGGLPPLLIVSTFIPNLKLDGWGTLAIGWYNDALLDPQKLSGYDLVITTNWDDFYDPNTGEAKAWLMADEVHPNSAGYAIMAENGYEALRTFAALKDDDEDGWTEAQENAAGFSDMDGDEHPAWTDFDCDGDVDTDDLAVIAGDWGSAEEPADVVEDGAVDASDLGVLAAEWNP